MGIARIGGHGTEGGVLKTLQLRLLRSQMLRAEPKQAMEGTPMLVVAQACAVRKILAHHLHESVKRMVANVRVISPDLQSNAPGRT